MSTTIKLRCVDQVLAFESTPLVASGGHDEDFVSFNFCSKWDGAEKTAVFWRKEDEVYHVLLKEDACRIPPEVLQTEGILYFGVFGVYANGKQRTTEVVRYNIAKGAITVDTKPSDPTPDIYTQLLASYTETQLLVEQRTQEMMDAVETCTTNLQQTVDDNTAAMQQTVETCTTNLQQTVETCTTNLQQTVDESKAELQQKYDEAMQYLGYSMDDVLTDETKALYDLTAEAVPDDVFKTLVGARVKVGDIKVTARSDLGESWLLCNGASVEVSEYEALANVISQPLSRVQVSKNLWNYKNQGNWISCVVYANGYWVVGGTYYDGASYYARIAYTTDPTSTWTTKDLWSSSHQIQSGVSGIAYADGRWVVTGKQYDGSSYHAKIAYTTDPTGNWTTKDLWSSGGLECIAYANGYWVVGGWQGSGSLYYARIAYAADPASTWATNDLWSGTARDYTQVTGVAYGDGSWAACGIYYDGSAMGTRVAYTDDLAGTWGTKDLWSGTVWTSERYANCITYANGYWAVGGTHYNGSLISGRLAYTTDLSGDWTTKQVLSTVICIAYLSGLWMIFGHSRNSANYYGSVAYASDITGSLTALQPWSGSYATAIRAAAYEDGCLVFVGGFQDSTGYYARLTYENKFILPTISQSGVYTYIKAKEA